MKFEKLYDIAFFFVIGCVIGATAIELKPNKKEKKYIIERLDTLTTRIDTTYITKEDLENKKVIVGGTFCSAKNTINIYYIKPKDTAQKTINYCNAVNKQIRYVKVHELEHAKKANLVENPHFFLPKTRAKIAAQNEIIAPAAEIIAALDLSYITKAKPANMRWFIKNAYNEMSQTLKKQPRPIDLNKQEVADIIIKHSLLFFLSEVKRGSYIGTMKREYNRIPNDFYYPPIDNCNIKQRIEFKPHLDEWAPLWQFNTKQGDVNIWNVASDKQKSILLNSIDSLVTKITGKQR